jgi:hypothetical protein
MEEMRKIELDGVFATVMLLSGMKPKSPELIRAHWFFSTDGLSGGTTSGQNAITIRRSNGQVYENSPGFLNEVVGKSYAKRIREAVKNHLQEILSAHGEIFPR